LPAAEAAESAGTLQRDAGSARTGRADFEDDDAGAERADAATGEMPAAGRGAAGGAATLPSAGAGGSTVKPTDPDSTECPANADTAAPERLNVTGTIQLSDPAVIEKDGTFYAFSTGPGVRIRTSQDLLSWRDAGSVFLFNPDWIPRTLEAEAELWSPDISFFGGQYHLYYAASKQGGNRSCIGHATAASLPGPFEDQGSVLCSNIASQKDDWNAIHPSYIADSDGAPHLAFGSFWSGLKLVALAAETGKPLDDKLIDLAARTQQGGAIEAPSIVRHCGFFYLFVSFDRCCDGVNSTYKIHVGRSEKLQGPYVDRMGTPMLEGGGTELVVADDTWHGPGHSAVFQRDDKWYEAHHAYYAGDFNAYFIQGEAYLRISELIWDADGWPVSAGP
jgi:arabinan endo-1,5-alpha-L-arabinosidase